MPAPAAQPGETSRYRPRWLADHRPGMPLSRFSDTFDGKALHPRWSWVRLPEDASTYGVRQGRFRFDVQAADLTRAETTKASVLVEDAPNRDYVVETKVRLNLPPEGCCHNYVQAGLVVYDNADRFIKLTHVSIFETRQTEFAKEVSRAFDDKHRYGNTVVGPPSTWTHLRIVRDERAGGRELYTAYTSRDGRRWVRGGTWTHRLGDNARIGLVSMGGVCERDAQGVVTTCSNTGYTARFAHVRVSRLAPSR
jgi:arabinan endo-1,5-alpha-L-arabinosidase